MKIRCNLSAICARFCKSDSGDVICQVQVLKKGVFSFRKFLGKFDRTPQKAKKSIDKLNKSIVKTEKTIDKLEKSIDFFESTIDKMEKSIDFLPLPINF